MMLLGVDGGGSKTAVLLVDASGRVIGQGKSGAAGYHVVGLETAFASVQEAVNSALDGRVPDAVCYCMADADMPHDFEVLRNMMHRLPFAAPFVVHNDVICIFRAGSRFSYGVGVVCGTGFNAGGISKSGREFRLPALGSFTGDRAGGGYLGAHALGAAFRAWDGRGEPTALSAVLLETLDVPDFETLAERYVQGTITHRHFINLAPLVFEVSEQGDPVAQRLIREQAIELGTAANAMLRKLELQDEDCDVVLGGSVCYGKGNLLMDTVRSIIGKQSPNAIVRRLEVPPVVGAVLLAADHIGVQVDENFIMTLRRTLPQEMNVPVV